MSNEHQKTELPEEVPGFLTRLVRFRREPWENVATVVIAAGVVMLMQPLSLALYTWSFITTLVGTLMFVIVSKFPD